MVLNPGGWFHAGFKFAFGLAPGAQCRSLSPASLGINLAGTLPDLIFEGRQFEGVSGWRTLELASGF